jgi:hypothetical protein
MITASATQIRQSISDDLVALHEMLQNIDAMFADAMGAPFNDGGALASAIDALPDTIAKQSPFSDEDHVLKATNAAVREILLLVDERQRRMSALLDGSVAGSA